MDYIIDGAYRAKKQFTALPAGNPVAFMLQFNQYYIPLVKVGTKAILQRRIPESGMPTHLIIYTVADNGMTWALQLHISRLNFDSHFEKMPLSVITHPGLMMKIKAANQTNVAHPIQR
jgi:hypothetical protein